MPSLSLLDIKQRCLLLTGLFVVLKLKGIINWSWTWVFMPIWFPIAIAVGVLIANAMSNKKDEEGNS